MPAVIDVNWVAIKPGEPMDRALAALQGGGKLPIGASIGSGRAEYYLDLRTLLTYAYGMSTTRFDIVAKMPEGSTKDDAPRSNARLSDEQLRSAGTYDCPVV
jgi:hypothetical protein